jgi:hypothetical protein
MISNALFRKMALALPGVEEKPHFEKASFRCRNKIFATLWAAERKAMLKLTPVQQSVYTRYDPAVFDAVPGTWGLQGATFVNLAKVNKAMLAEALLVAYNSVAKKTGK